jgi:hypothetical protein
MKFRDILENSYISEIRVGSTFLLISGFSVSRNTKMWYLRVGDTLCVTTGNNVEAILPAEGIFDGITTLLKCIGSKVSTADAQALGFHILLSNGVHLEQKWSESDCNAAELDVTSTDSAGATTFQGTMTFPDDLVD